MEAYMGSYISIDLLVKLNQKRLETNQMRSLLQIQTNQTNNKIQKAELVSISSDTHANLDFTLPRLLIYEKFKTFINYYPHVLLHEDTKKKFFHLFELKDMDSMQVTAYRHIFDTNLGDKYTKEEFLKKHVDIDLATLDYVLEHNPFKFLLPTHRIYDHDYCYGSEYMDTFLYLESKAKKMYTL